MSTNPTKDGTTIYDKDWRKGPFRFLPALVVAIALLVAGAGTCASEPQSQTRGVANIVLVHGAWADGSSWSKVIPLLAHTYGGAVITQAGNDSKVAGLVYVAAFAPAERESPFDLTIANPTPFLKHLQQDQFGFLKLTSTGIREDFAPDLSDSEQTVLAATQGPTSVVALGAPISTPAWRTKPCWFVIAAHDRVVAPTLQAMFAERMNATSVTLSSSPRGDVVPPPRRRFIHPQGGTRSPVTNPSRLAIRVYRMPIDADVASGRFM